MKKFAVLSLSLCVLLLGGCSTAVGPNPGPLTIGAVLPLTGIASLHGNSERKGIELAVHEINEAGGVDGRELIVRFEDDETDPKQTISGFNKLVGVDGVDIVIGGTWDFLANAVIPVADAQGKILVSPSVLPDTLEVQSDYFFTFYPPVAINESAFDAYLAQYQGKKVAAVVTNNPWGLAHMDTFKRSIAKTDNTLVYEATLPEFDGNNVQAELTKIASAGAEVVLTTINFADYVQLLTKRQSLGLDFSLLAHSNVINLYNDGKIDASVLDGVTVFDFTPGLPDFNEKYRAFYDEDPIIYGDTAYDAVYVIKEAMERADSSESDAVRRALRKVKDYNGASGLIDLRKNNYSESKQPVLLNYEGGAFAPYLLP